MSHAKRMTLKNRQNQEYVVAAIQQIDISFSCVCPVIDHEFRHNIVKVAVDPHII